MTKKRKFPQIQSISEKTRLLRSAFPLGTTKKDGNTQSHCGIHFDFVDLTIPLAIAERCFLIKQQVQHGEKSPLFDGQKNDLANN